MSRYVLHVFGYVCMCVDVCVHVCGYVCRYVYMCVSVFVCV